MSKGRLLSVNEVKKMDGKNVWVEHVGNEIRNGVYLLKKENLIITVFRFYQEGKWKFDLGSHTGEKAKYYEWSEEMKTYKTSEMIAMLEENSELRFESITTKGDYNTVSVVDNRVSWGGDYESPMYLVMGDECDKWQLVKPEPKEVTFIKAIDALNEGYIIRCKNKWGNNAIYKDGLRDELGRCIQTHEILKGKWFIEGDE